MRYFTFERLNLNKIKGYNDWKELASKELKDKSLNDHYWETPEGIKVKPLYTEEDLKSLNHQIGLPGLLHSREAESYNVYE